MLPVEIPTKHILPYLDIDSLATLYGDLRLREMIDAMLSTCDYELRGRLLRCVSLVRMRGAPHLFDQPLKVRRVALDVSSIPLMCILTRDPIKNNFILKRSVVFQETQHVTFTMADNDVPGVKRQVSPLFMDLPLDALRLFYDMFWYVIDPMLPHLKVMRVRTPKDVLFRMTPVTIPQRMQICTLELDTGRVEYGRHITSLDPGNATGNVELLYDKMAETLVNLIYGIADEETCIATSNLRRQFPVLEYISEKSDNMDIYISDFLDSNNMPNLKTVQSQTFAITRDI